MGKLDHLFRHCPLATKMWTIVLVWRSLGYAEKSFGYTSFLARLLLWSSSEHSNLESCASLFNVGHLEGMKCYKFRRL